MQIAQQGRVQFALRRRLADGATGAEGRFGRRDGVDGRPQGRVTFGLTGQPGQALLDGLEVGQDQLGVDGVDVAGRIHPRIDVDDIVVMEGAHHLADGIGLPDGRQKLVA